ncbi:MAG: stage II sporulation protein R [Clostridia bacterium]|nr:stage II sporulation protein R [Clostridia bacterium]
MRTVRWVKATAIGLVCCLMVSLCGFSATCEDISDRVLRLHVLAASDSAEDQALKLKVRDAVLDATRGMLDGVETTALAKTELEKSLEDIEAAAVVCLRENGSDDAVHVELRETYFTTRRYDTVTLPAGDYEALRVVIGEGQGKNWWCVVFPPMCLSGAQGAALSDVLTEEEEIVVTSPSRYQVRFKVVEWVQGIRHFFNK